MTDPATIDGRFVPRVKDGAASVEVDGERVILDEDTGELHLLNPSAGLVFACFDGTGTIDEIAADFSDVLGLPIAEARADVTAVAVQLAASGLLDGLAPPAEPHDHDHDGAGAAAAPVDAPPTPRFLVDPPTS